MDVNGRWSPILLKLLQTSFKLSGEGGLFVSLICRYVKRSGLKGIALPGGADLAGKL